jgi:two-component system sensor histidine kinase/response regulator
VPARLMIVDDEVPQLKALSFTLRDAGFEVAGFASPDEALAALAKDRFDLLLTDLNMPGMDGMAMFSAALEIDPAMVVIVMTGNGTIDAAVAAMRAGALDFIQKPFKIGAILPVLERAIAMRTLRRENAELQARVAERTATLEATNRELEAFSHSVSHDLRAPLRHMGGFASMLAQKYAADLPPDAKRLLDAIMSGAQKMSRLIEDLLEFSRCSRQPLAMRNVDMTEIAAGIVQEQRELAPDRSIDVELGKLPPCHGDPTLLRQVWANLISNAFKFTGRKAAPRIEIGFRMQGEERVYSVKDNGAGFDMRHQGKLFGVFQRFHTSQEFEGTGVGLSIVQRILARHGGRIWAESVVDEGTTFHFTLPGPIA